MRHFIVAFVASLWMLTGSAYAQTCLHGESSTPEQKARRATALSLMRAINTAEARFASQSNRQYGTLKELLDSGHLKPMLSNKTPLNFEIDEPILGWKLEFSSNREGYAFLLKDKTDPCSFAFFSTQDGLIFHGEPIR